MQSFNSPIDALISTLTGLQNCLSQLSDKQYNNPMSHVFNSSVGAHVRHSLDHINILLEAVSTNSNADNPVVYYDRRIRETELEKNRELSIATIKIIINKLKELTNSKIQQNIRIEHMMSGGGDCYLFNSNLARELFFVTHHAIHHNAIIGACLKEMGLSTTNDFGIAPSTLEYQSR